MQGRAEQRISLVPLYQYSCLPSLNAIHSGHVLSKNKTKKATRETKQVLYSGKILMLWRVRRRSGRRLGHSETGKHRLSLEVAHPPSRDPLNTSLFASRPAQATINACTVGEKKHDIFRPDVVGMRGSIVIGTLPPRACP